jgi:hypothetical protein
MDPDGVIFKGVQTPNLLTTRILLWRISDDEKIGGTMAPLFIKKLSYVLRTDCV